jgi:hypothetical protein
MLRYSEDYPADRYVHVITGNGRTERRILRAMSSKFDGHALALFFPAPPSSVRTGLQSMLEGAKVIMTSQRPLHILLLLDKDSMGSSSIHAACSEYGINIEVTEETTSFVEADFTAGSLRAHVYFAISGTRNIEEELSALIREVYGCEIAPTKNAIREYLSSQGMNYESLIDGAAVNDLEHALVGLSRALRRIEVNLALSS